MSSAFPSIWSRFFQPSSTDTFEVKFRRADFSSLGILIHYGDGIQGLLVEAVSEDVGTAAASYNSWAPVEKRIRPWQAIEKINGLTDCDEMVQEVWRAPVVRMRFSQSLTEEQERFATARRCRRDSGSKVLESFQDVQREEVEACSICLQDMDAKSRISRSPCGHYFHKECISKWIIERRITCPLCNDDLLKRPMSKPAVAVTVTNDLDEVRREFV